MTAERAEIIAQLKAQLVATGTARTEALAWESTAHDDLDALIGGWPTPGLVEIVGPPGSGRLGLLLPLLAEQTGMDRWVGIIDPTEWFHPPGLMGVDWSRVLLVRSGISRAVWAATQMAESGALAATILLDVPRLGSAEGRRLLRAAEQGGGTVWVIGEQPLSSLPAHLRLQVKTGAVGELDVEVRRRRGGPARSGKVSILGGLRQKA